VGFGERLVELKIIEQVIAEARSGKGAVVVVTGATGTGKTALLQAMIERAARDNGSCFTVTASASERPHPYGLLDQLVKVMRAGGMADPGWGDDTDGERRDPFAGYNRVYRAIHEFARSGSVLIGIDDVHFADEQSLRFLGYLIRRVAWSPVVIVLNGNSSYEREQAALNAEMLHLSHCHRLRLQPLTGRGIAELLAGRLGTAPDQAVAAFCAEVTGGVPLLLQGLLDDAAPDLRPGGSFRQAVLRSLHRCEPRVAAAARSIAVLGAEAGPSLVAEFLGADLPQVQVGIAELRAMGLLAGDDFRHEQTRLAVLATVPLDELPELRGRAAELLYRGGAPAGAAADQLMAAPGHGDPAWGGPIAREAAREAMAAGDVTRAVDYLRHAVSAGTDDAERIPATVLLADAQWHADPGKAARYLDDLVRDTRAGRVSGTDVFVVVHHLVWWGRLAEADEAFYAIAGGYGWPGGDEDCAVPAADTCLTLLWTIFSRAGLSTDTGGAAGWSSHAPDAWAGPMVAVAYLNAVATLDHDGAEAKEADQMLSGLRAGSSVTPALYALVLLVQTGRLSEAVRWSDRLLEEDWIRRTPMRRVMFELIKAVAALRQGQPAEALRCVERVLATVPPASWGIVAGLPLGLAVRAATEQGDFAVARSFLNFPVPAAMFDTPFALPYLQALARYHRAMGHPRTALTHLQSCARLMEKWAGEAPPVDAGPERGFSAPSRGPGAANGAADDRPARRRRKDGRHLHAVEADRERGPEAPPGVELTDAELRVASLAAAGDTNRQIARKLFITVSTVEQHLTKIYRKLNVRSRSGLSKGLRELRG
jgi:DNA-binding CsgD family transcriptional regulator